MPNVNVPGYDSFSSWYTPKGQGSGTGSHPNYTSGYRDFLIQFFSDHQIKSVLDYGCGDWQFSKLIPWGDIRYHGVDIVPELIERLQKNYNTYTRTFSIVDLQIMDLPSVDLVITKDVMQHLRNSEILRMEREFSKISKHVLWVNDLHPQDDQNNYDIPAGSYRRLNLSIPPFSFSGNIVFRFENKVDNKVVFHQVHP